MAGDNPFGDADDDADLLRPSWQDTPDETDTDRGVTWRPRPATGQARPSNPDSWLSDAALAALLIPLCDATDALARLDARAAAAPDAVRDGLRARMATAEAAGWLAHAHAWVHPLDLSLRAAGLTASTALAAVGRGARSLPQTFAGAADPLDWADPPFDAMADGDRAIADALSLVRLLRRLPARPAAGPFATPATAAAALAPLGAGDLDPTRLAVWWAAHAPAAPPRRRYGSRAGEGTGEKMPPLLAVARAAQGWMEAGLGDRPDPLHALLAAIGRCGGAGPAHTVFLPVWAAYPAVGFSARDALPGLRSDAADRVAGRGRPVTWPLAFLHLVAESARMALRELDRLEAAAAQGRGVVAGGDKRSRLPDALDALLRVPALTPKALAARLKVAPQTGTALLRVLQGRGVVREVTGRGSFRAFAI
jgi:HTH DNA binding domain